MSRYTGIGAGFSKLNLLQCNFCSAKFKLLYPLKRHVLANHSFDINCKIICNTDGSLMKLNDKLSLRKHVFRQHKRKHWKVPRCWYKKLPIADDDLFALNECSSGITSSNVLETFDATPVDHVPHDIETENVYSGVDDSIKGQNIKFSGVTTEDSDILVYNNAIDNMNCRKNAMVQSLCKLKYDCNLTETSLQVVLNWTENLLQECAKTIIGGIKSNLSSVSSKVNDVLQMGLALANPFYGMKTEKQRKKLLSCYVPPVTHILYEVPSSSSTPGCKCHSLQYVPLLPLLKSLFQNTTLYDLISSTQQYDENILENFDQGEYGSSHHLFGDDKKTIQLLFYYDGFEVVNPLGSKTGNHHMGALYFVVLNTNRKFRSSLDCIFLSTLFYTVDIKHPHIKWKKILQPLNDDLKQLELNGLKIKIGQAHVKLKGTIAQMSLDNLAAHSILGFTEKFSGSNTYVSRYCLCTDNDIQKKSFYKQCELRTKDSYDYSLAQVMSTGNYHHGIKFKCPILSSYFHPVDNYAADIHHDLFEGVVPHVLKITLRKLILEENYFSLASLNDRIDSFDYGTDNKNKPSFISHHKLVDGSRNLRQNGSCIEEENSAWKVNLLFLEIVDICCAARISRATLTDLEVSLQCFFHELKTVYPNEKITPKMHFLLMYPRLIKKAGPLVQFSCMRFEAKHKYMKRLVTSRNNYKNVPLTIASNRQIELAATICSKNLFDRDITIRGGEVRVSSSDISLQFNIPVVSFPSECYRKVKCVTFEGIVYAVDLILCTAVNRDLVPKFVKIEAIFLNESSEIIFVGNVLRSVCYCQHFHAWLVQCISETTICCQNSLIYPHPLSIFTPFGTSEKYVCPKFSLEMALPNRSAK